MRANLGIAVVRAIVNKGFLLFVTTAVGSLCFAATSTFGQTNWTLTTAPSNAWVAIAASADLSTIAAAASPGGIYYSHDSGTNWTESDAPTNNWAALASSTNGELMTAVVNGGGIWVSTDYGVSWSQTEAPSNEWAAVACTGDAVTIAAGGLGGVWISTNSGLKWHQAGVPNENNGEPLTYYAVACLPGVSQIAALSSGSGEIILWISPDFENFGESWDYNNYNNPDEFTSATDQSSYLAASGSEILVGNAAGWAGVLQLSSPPSLLAASPDASRLIVFGGTTNMYFDEPGSSSSWIPLTGLGQALLGAVISSAGNPALMLAIATNGSIYAWQPKGPAIYVQPQNQTAASATNLELTLGVITTIPLTYEWLFDNVPFETTTNHSLVLSNTSPGESGTYSVLVSNAFGSELSSNAVVTILPAVVSTESVDPALYYANLLGSVSSGFVSTAIYFEWGLTTNYGHQTPPTILQGPNTWSISNLISGLAPYTTYHCQAVASNVYGVVLGGDVSFTTVPKFVQVNDYTGWSALALSGDGNELVATSNDIVCISTNLGVTFSPTAGIGSVFSVSSNRQTILSASGTNIFLSLDQGATWSTNPAPTTFHYFAASYNCQNLAGCDGSAVVYTSTNFGATWTPHTVPYGPCTGLASSADGSVIYGAGGAGDGPGSPGYEFYGVYASPNFGQYWGSLGVFGKMTGGGGIACSADGSVIAEAAECYFMSTDGGNSWSGLGPLTDGSVACSADGKTILVTQWFQTSVSPDTGKTWYTANAPYIAAYGTYNSSANGGTLAILAYGTLYLSFPPPTESSHISVTTSDDVQNFSLSGQPGYTYIIQASTNLTAWTNIAIIVNSNGTVPFTDPDSTNYGQRFYRAIVP